MREKQARLADAEILYRFLSDTPEPPRQADLVLALGSHDRRVPDYAAAVYHSGAAPLLVCTGGLGRMTRDLWTEPEAEIFARRCRELGVPSECLLTEPRSTNTGENFVFTRELLASQGISPRSALIVCKPYMHKRALRRRSSPSWWGICSVWTSTPSAASRRPSKCRRTFAAPGPVWSRTALISS